MGKVEKEVVITISNRHVHLSQDDIYALFGEGAELPVKSLLAPPEKYENGGKADYASTRTVTLKGPKGAIEKVRVLGPARRSTQAEILAGDCYKLGVAAPVLKSVSLGDAAEITIIGDAGEITRKAAIIAHRHIHIRPDIAEDWGVKTGDFVCVETEGLRGVVMKNVMIDVNPLADLVMHIDIEEANAAGIAPNTVAKVII